MLERARWAATLSSATTASAPTRSPRPWPREAHAKAETYAEWAVRETGFGVVEHKKLKNELTSLPFLEYYRDWDFVDPALDAEQARRRDPAAGGRDLRADSLDQSDLDGLLQNPAARC